MHELSQQEIANLYEWIDAATYSRPKRSISRDFSDGVACAELIKHYLPKLVEIHNYSAAHSLSQKLYNWNTLNYKIFKKIGYRTTEEIIQAVATMRPGYAEYLLYGLRNKVTLINEMHEYMARNNLYPDLVREMQTAKLEPAMEIKERIKEVDEKKARSPIEHSNTNPLLKMNGAIRASPRQVVAEETHGNHPELPNQNDLQETKNGRASTTQGWSN